jgi:hypothetical protein
VVELLPLRRRDVEAVVGDLVDVEPFLQAAERRGVVPFAARPLTSRMLARAFAQDGKLPDRAADIYRRALLALCDEVNADRRESAAAALSPSQRLAVGRRIAAVTVFGGSSTLWDGPLIHHQPPDVPIDQCCGGEEIVDGTSVAVTEQAVRETLRTGLFSGRGLSRSGWTHATFADFLSADWLVTHRLTQRSSGLFCSHRAEGSTNRRDWLRPGPCPSIRPRSAGS